MAGNKKGTRRRKKLILKGLVSRLENAKEDLLPAASFSIKDYNIYPERPI
jgi:hypothetical protein